MLENVPLTYCEKTRDWGGVTREWVKQSAKDDTYNWDVDPKSIKIEESWSSGRYHYFMTKNP